MNDYRGLFIFLGFIIGAFIGGIIITHLCRKQQIECYQDYIETNVITTRCEKYFKDLKLGSDSNE